MGTMVDDEQNRVQGSRTGPVAEFLVKNAAIRNSQARYVFSDVAQTFLFCEFTVLPYLFSVRSAAFLGSSNVSIPKALARA